MAKVNIEFTVTPGPGVIAFWIAVGAEDVQITNNKGHIQLEKGAPTVLVWWFMGNPGSTLGIKGQDGARVVVEVKESKIPQGRTQGSGFKHFTP